MSRGSRPDSRGPNNQRQKSFFIAKYHTQMVPEVPNYNRTAVLESALISLKVPGCLAWEAWQPSLLRSPSKSRALGRSPPSAGGACSFVTFGRGLCGLSWSTLEPVPQPANSRCHCGQPCLMPRSPSFPPAPSEQQGQGQSLTRVSAGASSQASPHGSLFSSCFQEAHCLVLRESLD